MSISSLCVFEWVIGLRAATRRQDWTAANLGLDLHIDLLSLMGLGWVIGLRAETRQDWTAANLGLDLHVDLLCE
jgi:hypothetical protein